MSGKRLTIKPLSFSILFQCGKSNRTICAESVKEAKHTCPALMPCMFQQVQQPKCIHNTERRNGKGSAVSSRKDRIAVSIQL